MLCKRPLPHNKHDKIHKLDIIPNKDVKVVVKKYINPSIM
jgi:hypothetical protein